MNHNLNSLKQAACNLLMSKVGVEHRSKKLIKPQAVLGHIKVYDKFRRLRLRGIVRTNLAFGPII